MPEVLRAVIPMNRFQLERPNMRWDSRELGWLTTVIRPKNPTERRNRTSAHANKGSESVVMSKNDKTTSSAIHPGFCASLMIALVVRAKRAQFLLQGQNF